MARSINLRVLFGVLCLIAAGIWFAWLMLAPPPPTPDNLERIDVLVRRRIHHAVMRVEERPHDMNRWMDLAHVYHANEYGELAERCYRHVLENKPNESKAWYGLALLYDADGRINAAFDALDRAIDRGEPYEPAYWRRALWSLDHGAIEQAQSDVQRAQALASSVSGSTPIAAKLHLVLDQPQQTVTMLEQYLVENPDDAYAYRILAQAYRRVNRPDDAMLAHARSENAQSLFDDPWRAEILAAETGFMPRMHDARQLLSRGDVDNAIDVYELLFKEFPDDATIAANLALAYARSERFQQAIDVLETVIERVTRPADRARLLARKGDVYHRQGDHESALQAAEQAIDVQRTMGLAHEVRAEALMELKRHDEARKAFAEATRLLQHDAMLAFRYGQLQALAGDLHGAADAFQQAIDRDPLLLVAWLNLAMVHAQQDRFEDAEHAMSMARRIAPQSSQLQRAAARIEQLRAQTRQSEQADTQPDTQSP